MRRRPTARWQSAPFSHQSTTGSPPQVFALFLLQLISVDAALSQLRALLRVSKVQAAVGLSDAPPARPSPFTLCLNLTARALTASSPQQQGASRRRPVAQQ